MPIPTFTNHRTTLVTIGFEKTEQALIDVLNWTSPRPRRNYSQLMSRAARQTIMKYAKALTPKRTGVLRKSWRTTSTPRKRGFRYPQTPFTTVGVIKPGAWYLHLVTEGIAGRHRTTPNRILDDAVRAGSNPYVQKFQELAEKEIIKIAKKANAKQPDKKVVK